MKNILLILLLAVGCSTNQKPEYVTSTNIANIAQVPNLPYSQKPIPPKPQITLVGDKVELDKRGLVDLVNLYKEAKTNTNERNDLLKAVNKVIDERNQLLTVAKAEEARANGLGKQLQVEQADHESDNLRNSIELNITRAAFAILAIGL